MTSLPDLQRQGTAYAWLFVPTAILLDFLHGLEHGHSKTMMAAFIIAVRGTIAQAVLLGLAAKLSHTVVVWAITLLDQYFGQQWGETSEPYFQLASAVLIVGIAIWMAWRTWREQHHDHPHHHDEVKRVPTCAGMLTLEVFEVGVPPRWRVVSIGGPLPKAGALMLETLRSNDTRQAFRFVRNGDTLESLEEIPKPHAFTVRLHLRGSAGTEVHEIAFEEHGHGHDHMNLGEEDDAHARAHAEDIRRRFAGRSVTTGQIVMFGLTGGGSHVLQPLPSFYCASRSSNLVLASSWYSASGSDWP